MNNSNATRRGTNGRLPQIHENVRAQAPPLLRRSSKLPNTYSPGSYDVICGKGKSCFNHIGNRRFRITVELHLPRYTQSPSRVEKSSIVASIVDIVRSTGAVGFVKRDPDSGDWYDVGDHAAREKVGQTIRDILKQRDPVRRARKNLLRQQARAAKAKKSHVEWSHQPCNDSLPVTANSSGTRGKSSPAFQPSSTVHQAATNALFSSAHFHPSKMTGQQDISADAITSVSDWSLFKAHDLSTMFPPTLLFPEKQHCC
mmetsp:Transcript_5685/g.9892  ORF Transcript_5685/g.9892 Transcript_5685/m.9892 type:complete len:257 (-) Transcript_5685:122-892(-)